MIRPDELDKLEHSEQSDMTTTFSCVCIENYQADLVSTGITTMHTGNLYPCQQPTLGGEAYIALIIGRHGRP